MILYHYTSPQHLLGIAKHGLTIGGVPTDLGHSKGRVGVWPTTPLEEFVMGLPAAQAYTSNTD